MSEKKQISFSDLKTKNNDDKSTTSENLGITSSPSTTTQISIDITNSKLSLLGKMVYLEMEEEEKEITALGQITSVETKNRWYEDPTFKGIIKQQGNLPDSLKERADTRLASLNVQSCFIKQESSKVPVGHVLGISPSTGLEIKKMDDAFMKNLVEGYGDAIQYIGTVYGSKKVNMPMWFRHFGKAEVENDYTGVGDALHIGVFDKTGSGKTVMSSLMMISYAKSKKMNLLVFDPQGQFYQDRDLLPDGEKLEGEKPDGEKLEGEKPADQKLEGEKPDGEKLEGEKPADQKLEGEKPDGQKLEDAVKKIEGSKYKKYKLAQDISLPKDDFELFGNLLLESDYIRQAFNLTSTDKKKDMKDLIVNYLKDQKEDQKLKDFTIKDLEYEKMLEDLKKSSGKVYKRNKDITSLEGDIETAKINKINQEKFKEIQTLFIKGEKEIKEVIKEVVSPEEKGHFIIIDTSLNGKNSDKYQALFLELIEKAIIEESEKHYSSGGELSNALIVMDEAHRFISKYSDDDRKKELTKNIVDAVRTTRKYGVGHMFITQTLESLHQEIIKQLRIHVFGYGLTTGDELRKIRNVINSESALDLYKSFVDPSNTKRYPFMFVGAVSPLSLSGSPLFIEAYNNFQEYMKNNS